MAFTLVHAQALPVILLHCTHLSWNTLSRSQLACRRDAACCGQPGTECPACDDDDLDSLACAHDDACVPQHCLSRRLQLSLQSQHICLFKSRAEPVCSAALAVTKAQLASFEATAADSAESESAGEADYSSSCSSDEPTLQHAAPDSALHAPAQQISAPHSCGADLPLMGWDSGALFAQGIRQRYPELFGHAAPAQSGHAVLDSQAGTTALAEPSATATAQQPAEALIGPELTAQQGLKATALTDVDAPALQEQTPLDLAWPDDTALQGLEADALACSETTPPAVLGSCSSPSSAQACGI